MNNTNAFHLLLKQSREEYGMTQVDVAKSLNIARQTYLDLEYGRTQPRLDTLLTLASLFNKSVAFFAGERPSLDGFETKALFEELQQRYVALSANIPDTATATPE
ncbi:helix-turn-helix transcriptional regulator [Photobacterium leiognathi]|uniref:helix-turn-helix transcriptional regulator n=1 Tax=Photobacterium leiognathi TaxID=553611 RepID=UPI002980E192|nr:helix-turn-helix transcriptional regulator [Photobacterium leiognathi]